MAPEKLNFLKILGTMAVILVPCVGALAAFNNAKYFPMERGVKVEAKLDQIQEVNQKLDLLINYMRERR